MFDNCTVFMFTVQVCGIVNDTGVLLDHLENLESLFTETVKSETARFGGHTISLSDNHRMCQEYSSRVLIIVDSLVRHCDWSLLFR